MNAVQHLVRLLDAGAIRARLEREKARGGGARRLVARWELDLVGFLNGATAAELRVLCAGVGLAPGAPGLMRQQLWTWGAAQERRALGNAAADVDSLIQPAPAVARGKLRLPRRPRPARVDPGALPTARAARFPECCSWPRPVPGAREPQAVVGEPTSVGDLLARADALVGVRLGARGRDKGYYGQRVADLLGIARSSAAAPDWRGEVELKTLAVVRAGGSRWRIKDGPAISMRSVDARGKLARALWVVRIDEGEVPGAPVLSWFYQELDDALTAALERARHLRPKGGAGTLARGWYLRREFFAACGLLRSLNGD